jgi:hypothetical protein
MASLTPVRSTARRLVGTGAGETASSKAMRGPPAPMARLARLPEPPLGSIGRCCADCNAGCLPRQLNVRRYRWSSWWQRAVSEDSLNCLKPGEIWVPRVTAWHNSASMAPLVWIGGTSCHRPQATQLPGQRHRARLSQPPSRLSPSRRRRNPPCGGSAGTRSPPSAAVDRVRPNKVHHCPDYSSISGLRTRP